MKRLILFGLCLVLASSSLFSKTGDYDASKMFGETRQEPVKGPKPLAKCAANTITVKTLTKSYADNIFLSGSADMTVDNFPINSLESGTLKLKVASSAVDANTKWVVQTKEGLKQVKGPNIACYKGEVAGDPDSKVFFTYCDGNLFGYVHSHDGLNYDITTLPDLDSKGRKQIAITEQNYRLRENPGMVGFIDKDFGPEPKSNSFDDDMKNQEYALGKNSKLLECKITIDAIYNFYELMNKDRSKVMAYISGVMSHVSSIYEEYVNVKITLPLVLMREDSASDPYLQKGYQTFDYMLPYMSTIWAHADNRPEGTALVCMFTNLAAQPGRDKGGVVAGLSYGGDPGTGSLCNLQQGYSCFGMENDFKFNNYNYTWDVSVAAHEIGHNFGSPHTHKCYYRPPIDTCVTLTAPLGGIADACLSGTPVPNAGTIMSYCHLTNGTSSVELRFHPREVGNMRRAASYASCISEPSSAVIDVLSPLVNNKFVSGDVIPIRWTSSKVNYLNIYYTTDDGATWEPIASNVAANDSIYNWTAPSINTKNMLFKLQDNTNEGVFKISDSPVTIVFPTIKFITPAVGAQYSKKEKMEIVWEANASNKYNCFLSTDGAANWTLIGENIVGSAYQLDLKDIESASCFFKVVDVDRPTLIKVSPKFSVGNETMTLTEPMPGDTICANYAYNVKWNSQFVHSVLIKYSTDNGATWKNMTSNTVDANQQGYTWPVPKIKSDSVMIKVILKDDKSLVLSETQSAFAIDTCLMLGINDHYEGSSVKILSVSPNPASRLAELRFTSDETINGAEVAVIGINGQTVFTQNVAQTVSGLNSVSLDLSQLAPGKYFVAVKAGKAILHYPISIIR